MMRALARLFSRRVFHVEPVTRAQAEDRRRVKGEILEKLAPRMKGVRL